MPSRLETLKAEHPEWCFVCGKMVDRRFKDGLHFLLGPTHQYAMGEATCQPHPVIAALVAALGEVDAELETRRLTMLRWERESPLLAQLAAEREAQEKTREALEEALRGFMCTQDPAIYPVGHWSHRALANRAALHRQAQRQGGEVK